MNARARAVLAKMEAENNEVPRERLSRIERLLAKVEANEREAERVRAEREPVEASPAVESEPVELAGGMDPHDSGSPYDAERDAGDSFARQYGRPKPSGIGDGMMMPF